MVLEPSRDCWGGSSTPNFSPEHDAGGGSEQGKSPRAAAPPHQSDDDMRSSILALESDFATLRQMVQGAFRENDSLHLRLNRLEAQLRSVQP